MVVAVGLGTVGVVGYVGFLSVVDGGVGADTLALAAATGFAAFFSPYSFPLLLTFLARRSEVSTREAMVGSLRVGIGATAFLGLLAVAIGAIGTAVAGVVAFDSTSGRVFRGLVGGFLIVMGLRNARLLTLRMSWLDRVASAAGARFDSSSIASPGRRDFVYGFGYLMAGFG